MKFWRRGLAILLGAGLSLAVLGCTGDKVQTQEDGFGQESLYTTAPTASVATPEPVPVILEEPVTTFPQYLDLDGDGVKELLELEYPEEPMTEEGAEEKMLLRIVRGDVSWQSEVAQSEDVRLFVLDMDGDGMEELLLEVQLGETVFRVYGWRFAEEQLEPLTFAGESTFAGRIKSQQGRWLTLGRWVELLGSWELEQDWRLGENDFLPDGEVWTVATEGEEYPLTVLTDVYAYAEDEDEGVEMLLYKGLRLRLTATDLKETVWFETETGERGYLSMEQDAEGHFVRFNGLEEWELFETLPYAG